MVDRDLTDEGQLGSISSSLSDAELTGANRVGRSVLTTWVAHGVVVVTGFIVPRLIDEKLGQISLGIWDLAWSTVNYLSLTNFGMPAALGRYVALYRASAELDELRCSVSSVVLLQLFITLILIFAVGAVVYLLPYWITFTDASVIKSSQLVVLFLAVSMVIRILTGPARGILTGCHRWDI